MGSPNALCNHSSKVSSAFKEDSSRTNVQVFVPVPNYPHTSTGISPAEMLLGRRPAKYKRYTVLDNTFGLLVLLKSLTLTSSTVVGTEFLLAVEIVVGGRFLVSLLESVIISDIGRILVD